MNALQSFCALHGHDPVQAMNLLQGNNIVADEAVDAADVADVDCQRAIDFLEGQPV